MILASLILTSLSLAFLGATVVLGFLIYNRLSHLMVQTNLYRADELTKAISQPKQRKPILPVQKQEQRGRHVVSSEELVDLSELSWEDGYKAIEELGQ